MRRKKNPLRQAPLLAHSYVRVNHDPLRGPHALVPQLRLNNESALGAIRNWRTCRQLPSWLLTRPDRTPFLARLCHHFPLLVIPAKMGHVWVTPHRHYQFPCQARIRVPTAHPLPIEPMFWHLMQLQTSPRPLQPFNAGFAWQVDIITSHAPSGSIQAITTTPPVTLLIHAQTLDILAPGMLGPLFTKKAIRDHPLPHTMTPLVSFDGQTTRHPETRCARRTPLTGAQ